MRTGTTVTQPPGAPDWSVGIVVPARNEERLIGRCLSALAAARTRLRAERPHALVRTTVVLDSCTDGTAEIVARFQDVSVVAIDACRVGTARAAGVAHLQPDLRHPRRSWIASTDADSAVPETWLRDQLVLADSGVELVTGFVTTDLTDTPTELHDVAPTPMRLPPGHPHVYGANLGCTLQAYLTIGGFAPLSAHEDVALVERARSHGVRCHASATLRVLTSGRIDGRTPEGFATYLRALTPGLAEETA